MCSTFVLLEGDDYYILANMFFLQPKPTKTQVFCFFFTEPQRFCKESDCLETPFYS